jgi:hypothetical protein
MKIDIDLLHSCSIKRKKPWPKLSWLGKVTNFLFFTFILFKIVLFKGKRTNFFI